MVARKNGFSNNIPLLLVKIEGYSQALFISILA